MSAQSAWLEIPEHLRQPLGRYLIHSLHPGSFLRAVIANNLTHTIAAADETSLHALRPLVLFLSNYAPAYSCGYAGAYQIWTGMSQSERLAIISDCDAFDLMLADSGIAFGIPSDEEAA